MFEISPQMYTTAAAFGNARMTGEKLAEVNKEIVELRKQLLEAGKLGKDVPCPYCAQMIASQALICNYCQGAISIGSPEAIRAAVLMNPSLAIRTEEAHLKLVEVVKSFDVEFRKQAKERKRIEKLAEEDRQRKERQRKQREQERIVQERIAQGGDQRADIHQRQNVRNRKVAEQRRQAPKDKSAYVRSHSQSFLMLAIWMPIFIVTTLSVDGLNLDAIQTPTNFIYLFFIGLLLYRASYRGGVFRASISLAFLIVPITGILLAISGLSPTVENFTRFILPHFQTESSAFIESIIWNLYFGVCCWIAGIVVPPEHTQTLLSENVEK